MPEPVQRWLGWSHAFGTARPTTVRLKQEGRFRAGEGRGWMPFTAPEHPTTASPGFVWTTMRTAPLVSIVGRDRYVDGRGSIEMRALGLVPVADAGGPELDHGALLQYLNETMWFPAAALSRYISWEGIDGTAARATMSHGGVIASATFVCDGEGRPTDMIGERYDPATGRLETWSMPITAYGEFGGVRIPAAGQGVGRYDTGDFSYFELRLTEVAYDGPERF